MQQSHSGSLVYWCLGAGSASSPSLKVVNGRGYTAAAESTPGLSIDDSGPSDLIGIISNIFKDAPRGKGDTVTLVGPGATQSYAVSGTGSMGVRLRPSVGGYLVSAAQYAADTLALVLPYAGKSGLTQSAIIKLFDWESCLSGYSSMATADIQTATQASNYMSDAIGTTLGCMSGALERAGLSFFGTAFAAGLSWFIAGLRTAANGFGTAADTALNPNGYTILVTAPAPALPGLPAELNGKWCTRDTPQDCFSAADTLAQFPQAFVESADPDPDVSGATVYDICLEKDLDTGCSMAATYGLEYFPVGVKWDCTAVEVTKDQFPKCDPDYTADHDPSKPRLVNLLNHQQGVNYQDAPPMYRVNG